MFYIFLDFEYIYNLCVEKKNTRPFNKTVLRPRSNDREAHKFGITDLRLIIELSVQCTHSNYKSTMFTNFN